MTPESSTKKTMVRHTVRYASANYAAQGIGIVNSVLLRRFMGPAAMGVWSLIQVILGWCGHASFGTTKALARDYPIYRGKGDHVEADKLKDVTMTFTMFMSLIPSAIILGYAFIKGPTLETAYRSGLIFLAVFLFLQRFYDLVITLLRSDKCFNLLSLLVIANALAGLAMTATLVQLWNIYGLYAGTAVVTAGCLYFLLKAHPYHFKLVLDPAILWRELRLGIPLVGITFLLSFLKGLDKMLIAKELGFYEVGLYSIAMMVNSYVGSAPMMFNHVWYPNLQQAYGREGSSEAIRHYLEIPALFLSVFIPFVAAGSFFFMPLLVTWFLPKFTPGLPAMEIYMIATLYTLLAQFSYNFLTTLDKYMLSLPLLAVALGINYGANTFFLRHGYGFEGVAVGTSLSFVFYGLSSYVLALRLCGKGKEGAGPYWIPVVIPAVLFSAAFGLSHAFGNTSVPLAFLKMLLMTLISTPFFLHLEKRAGVFSHGLEFVRSKFGNKAGPEEK